MRCESRVADFESQKAEGVQMARRNEVVPEDFLFHLQRTIKPLAKETYPHQVAIARMLWESISSGRARSHARYAGYLSFTYKELDAAFGRRKFAELNARLRLFNETSWSHQDLSLIHISEPTRPY